MADLELARQRVINAALYVVRTHIPHLMPKKERITVKNLVRWGAIMNLHDTVAEMTQAQLGHKPSKPSRAYLAVPPTAKAKGRS